MFSSITIVEINQRVQKLIQWNNCLQKEEMKRIHFFVKCFFFAIVTDRLKRFFWRAKYFFFFIGTFKSLIKLLSLPKLFFDFRIGNCRLILLLSLITTLLLLSTLLLLMSGRSTSAVPIGAPLVEAVDLVRSATVRPKKI
jgi:hypothetical protein